MNKKLISAGLGALILTFQLGTAANAHQGNSDEMVSGLVKLDRFVLADDLAAVQALLQSSPELASLVSAVMPEGVSVADRRKLSRESLREYGVRTSRHEEKRSKHKHRDKHSEKRSEKHDDDHDDHDDDHQY